MNSVITDRQNGLIINAIKSELFSSNCSSLIAIYIFGSFASENITSESDIDIAILTISEYSVVAFWEAAQNIAAKIKRDVDLINLRNASTVMRMEVISKGKRIYCADADYCETYEDYIFSSYARLNEERREIMTDIQSRGSVYG